MDHDKRQLISFAAIILSIVILLFLNSVCKADEEPPKIGNFSLPYSQQPGPLIGFGENILEKHETQLYFYADDFAGINKHFVDFIPQLLYGITDTLSIFINTPYAVSYETGPNKSSGFEDAFAQLEYAYYNHSTSHFTEQATLLANMAVPTGSINKIPATGVGSLSFLLAGTYNRTYKDWFVFGCPAVEFTTAKNGTKFGNSYFYQFGFGREIAFTHGWLLAWMTEINGTYTQRNRVRGVIDSDSGGNIVYVTPSIWASTKKMIMQFGAGYAVTQNLYGSQTRSTYLIAANVGWRIC